MTVSVGKCVFSVKLVQCLKTNSKYIALTVVCHFSILLIMKCVLFSCAKYPSSENVTCQFSASGERKSVIKFLLNHHYSVVV